VLSVGPVLLLGEPTTSIVRHLILTPSLLARPTKHQHHQHSTMLRGQFYNIFNKTRNPEEYSINGSEMYCLLSIRFLNIALQFG
jgi:hypothetical protein